MAGCPGDFEGQLHDGGLEAAGPVKLDKQIQVQGLDRGGQESGAAQDSGGQESGGACTPESDRTTCSPLTSTECEQGAACYIVQGEYLDCVCPQGSTAIDQPCNTATDCAPGLTCYSATNNPPGACRALCDCSSMTGCLELANFAPFGICPDPN